MRLIAEAGGLDPTDFPPCLDLEGGASKNLPGGVFVGGETQLPVHLVAEEALEFLQTIEAGLGVTPMVYTGQAFHWWFSQGAPELAALFAKYPLWLASYSKEPAMPVDNQGVAFPWPQWSIWQHTGSGKVAGVTGAVDVNKFRGTLLDMETFITNQRHKVEKPQDPMLAVRIIRRELTEEARLLVVQLAECLEDLATFENKG